MDVGHEGLSDCGNYCKNAPASETVSDINQARLESLEKKAVHLRLVLEKDFKSADIRWSLFVAAAFSFRHESCLRPFPPAFLKNGLKDMDELLSVVTDVPALDLVLQQLDHFDNLCHISDILDLLFYVLVRLKEPSLRTVPAEAHEEILMNARSVLPAAKPQYIFQVVSSAKSTAEAKWRDMAKNSNVFYAFHGNRLENFYAILNFGLQQHFSKNSQLGNGVYLSPELSAVLPHSHSGFGWGASCIGGHLSCVALVEVIDAPDGINYQRPNFQEGDTPCVQTEERPSERRAHGDQGPEETAHYFVTNSELMRVRYLLVYAKQPTTMRFPTTSANRNNGGFRQWLSRHKLFSILLGYGVMLATIGLANNQPMQHYYKLLVKKFDIVFNNIK